MTVWEWIICIGLGGLFILAAAAALYSRYHAGKDDELAVGRKSGSGGRSSRSGQLYTFTTPDGKIYTRRDCHRTERS